jgi:hypothetical protein
MSMQPAMVLLAMSKLSAYALYLMGAMYVFLSAYVLFGGWRLTKGGSRVRLIWLLLLPIVLFITLWFSGRWIWTVFWWGFVFGDAGPYEEYGRLSSGIVAIVVSATAFARLALGGISRRYLRITSWGTVASAGLFLAVQTHEFTHNIYGWTARSAAENYLAKFRGENHPFTAPDAPRRIVEENIPRPGEDPTQLGRSRRFVLYYGDGPIQDVRVVPYGWFWWTFGSSVPTVPVTDMDWAVAHWETDQEEAAERLNAVIRKYPNSDASRWASATLKKLREQGSSGVRGWKSEMMRRLQEEASKRRAQSTEKQ